MEDQLKQYIEKKKLESNLSPSKYQQIINLEKILNKKLEYKNLKSSSLLLNKTLLENDLIGIEPFTLKKEYISNWLSESNENFVLIIKFNETYKNDYNNILLLNKNYFVNPNVRDIFLECVLEKQQLLVNETFKSKNIFISLKYLTSKNLIIQQNDIKKLLKNNNILELSERYNNEFISRELLQLSQFGLNKQKTDKNLSNTEIIKQKYIEKKNIPYKKDVYFEEILSKALLNYSFQWDAAINSYLRYGESYFHSSIFNNYMKRFGDNLRESSNAIRSKVTDIDRAFLEAAPRNENSQQIFFRGMKRPFEFDKVGSKIIIKNFISVSSNLSVAYRFIDRNSILTDKPCCLYYINIAKGIPIIDMVNTTKFKNEKEILLPRDLEFTLKYISYTKYLNKEIPVYNLDCNMSRPDQFKIFNGCYKYTLCKISPSNLFSKKQKENIKPPSKKQEINNIEQDIINNPMHNIKRCPKGSRKNKKTGKCESNTNSSKLKNNEKENTTKKLNKRCPNGTRKNKITGLCESK